MVFYDLHVHTKLSIGEDTLEDVTETARRLGLAGIGVVQYYGSPVEELPRVNNVDVVSCVMIKPRNPEELNSIAPKARNNAEILMVHGGDYDVNRAACENSMIDVLCHPELGRKDSGLDHICVRAAADNNVAVEVNFREVLESHKKTRVHVISAMRKNVKLCGKYGASVIVASGSVTKWGMRSGRELAAVAHILGMDLGRSIESVSTLPEKLVRENREKLTGKRWKGASVKE